MSDVKIHLDGPSSSEAPWHILIDGKLTPYDAHYRTAREAKERAEQIIGRRPLPDMTRGYLQAALWASTDPDSGLPLDRTHALHDFSERARATALEEVDDFASACGDALERCPAEPAAIGHDFFLTRNRHGAGFLDRNYGAELCATFTRAAHNAGSSDVLQGPDGKLELS